MINKSIHTKKENKSSLVKIDNEEIEKIINKNEFPKDKLDTKDEEQDQSSALGSIGLKPKIVH